VKVLGIESSCDETAAAVVVDGRRELASVVASQAELHARTGGVVPEVASRQHVHWIGPVIAEALEEAGLGLDDIDGVAVTRGPGLAGSLLVGVSAAKALAWARGLPLVGVNHLEGHIYANFLLEQEPVLPLVCLIVSGGHTDLILMTEHLTYQRLGRTRDDAAGEAFDKVARILGLGYPGGPAVERAAVAGDPGRAPLPRAWLPDSLDFSFSGLKTAVLRMTEGTAPPAAEDVAAGFQESVVDVLVAKTARAAQEHGARTVLLAGGVAANSRLRERMAEVSPAPLLYPPLRLCTDNAAMIAAAGCYRLAAGHRHGLDLDVSPSLKLI
jgi:N6-L-threonylcarbamoyladenine synthase